MTYSHGDVVLVEFVFTNHRQTKKRPALILSTEEFSSDRDEVVLAAITSNLTSLRTGDTDLEFWEKAGLRLPSIATSIVQTIKSQMIIKQLGHLETSDLIAVEANLRQSLGLDLG